MYEALIQRVEAVAWVRAVRDEACAKTIWMTSVRSARPILVSVAIPCRGALVHSVTVATRLMGTGLAIVVWSMGTKADKASDPLRLVYVALIRQVKHLEPWREETHVK